MIFHSYVSLPEGNMAVTWHEAPELHKPRHTGQPWPGLISPDDPSVDSTSSKTCGPDEDLRSNQPQIPFGNQTWLARKSPMELCSWESHQTKCWIFQQAMAGRSPQALFRRVQPVRPFALVSMPLVAAVWGSHPLGTPAADTRPP